MTFPATVQGPEKVESLAHVVLTLPSVFQIVPWLGERSGDLYADP